MNHKFEHLITLIYLDSTSMHLAAAFSNSADVIKALFGGLEPGDKLKLLMMEDGRW